MKLHSRDYSDIKKLFIKKHYFSETRIQHLKDRMLVSKDVFYFYYTLVRDRKSVLYDNEVVYFKLMSSPFTSHSELGVGKWVYVVLLGVDNLGKWVEDDEILLLKLTPMQYKKLKKEKASRGDRVFASNYFFRTKDGFIINSVKFEVM